MINNVTNTYDLTANQVFNLGILATVTGSVTHATSADYATGAGGALWATNLVGYGFSARLTMGGVNSYGSTNDCMKVGKARGNSNYAYLDFGVQQKGDWLISAERTRLYKGGAITDSVWWVSGATTNQEILAVRVGGFGSDADPALITYQTVTQNVNSTAFATNQTVFVFTPTNCPAGVPWRYEFQRLGSTAVSNLWMVENALWE
ncbi:hypothetical protein CCP3SC15_4290001 [Gammaproteobacteria bacterium]